MNRLDQYKSKYERYSKMLLSVSTGVRHLQNKTECISNEIGNDAKVYFSEKTLVDVLRASGDVLKEVLSRIKRFEYTNKTYKDINSFENYSLIDVLETLNEDEVQVNRPFNQRVVLPSTKGDALDDTSDFRDSFDELDEEELSRDRVKKNSTQILQAQERKKRREIRQARFNSQTC